MNNVYLMRTKYCMLDGEMDVLPLLKDEQKRELFEQLNDFAKKNIGLLIVSDQVMNNYKKVIAFYEKDKQKFMKEILIARTIIMNIECIDDKKIVIDDFYRKFKEEHEINYIINHRQLLKQIGVDMLVNANTNKCQLYYNKNEEEYIKNSMKYLINTDKENLELYDMIIKLYRDSNLIYKHKDNIIEFPKKKKTLKSLVKKIFMK